MFHYSLYVNSAAAVDDDDAAAKALNYFVVHWIENWF